ncbi:hypothetical protein M8494_27470 [Serratia ureilytica]
MPAADGNRSDAMLADSAPTCSRQTAAGQLDHRAGGHSEHPDPSSPVQGRLVHRDLERADRQPGGVSKNRPAGQLRRKRRLL